MKEQSSFGAKCPDRLTVGPPESDNASGADRVMRIRILLRTPTILTTLKTSTMEKKFIQKCNLGEILEALAESALRNIDKVNVEISFQEVCKSKMLVVVVRDANDFSRLSCGEYVIVENDMDEGDILDETVSDALAKRAELQNKEINNQ